jgi:hypothetical protein
VISIEKAMVVAVVVEVVVAVVAVLAVDDIQTVEAHENMVAMVVDDLSFAGCLVHSCYFLEGTVAGCWIHLMRCCVLARCTFVEEAACAVSVAVDEIVASGTDL